MERNHSIGLASPLNWLSREEIEDWDQRARREGLTLFWSRQHGTWTLKQGPITGSGRARVLRLTRNDMLEFDGLNVHASHPGRIVPPFCRPVSELARAVEEVWG